MIVITGTVRIPVQRLAEAREHIEALVIGGRQEAGCVDYAFAEDLLVPGMVRIAETWRDKAALDAHALAPHFLPWRAAGASLGVSDRDLTMFTVSAAEPF